MADATVTLKRGVVVKVVMTGAFRDQLIHEAQESIRRMDENLAAVEKAKESLSTMQTPDPQQVSQVTEHLTTEREKLTRMKSELEWRIREVQGVDDGAELPFRTFEGTTTLAVGDNFLEKMANAEIVLKDWQVVEIRQG